MLTTRYCRVCKKLAEIVRWDKDDPVLSCGHVKRRSAADDRVAECARDIQSTIPKGIRDDFLRVVVEEWVREQEEGRIAFCPICEQTVSTTERNGKQVCGGDLLQNPGCGCCLPLRTPLPPKLKCG